MLNPESVDTEGKKLVIKFTDDNDFTDMESVVRIKLTKEKAKRLADMIYEEIKEICPNCNREMEYKTLLPTWIGWICPNCDKRIADDE